MCGSGGLRAHPEESGSGQRSISANPMRPTALLVDGRWARHAGCYDFMCLDIHPWSEGEVPKIHTCHVETWVCITFFLYFHKFVFFVGVKTEPQFLAQFCSLFYAF